MKNLLLKDLANRVDVIISPNKPNIKHTVNSCDTDDIRVNFAWIIQLLMEKRAETPRMIFFFRKVEYMSTFYKHVAY